MALRVFSITPAMAAKAASGAWGVTAALNVPVASRASGNQRLASSSAKAAAKFLFGVVQTADEPPIHCSSKGSSRSVDWIVSTPVVSPVIADWSQHWTPMLHLP